MTVPKINDNDFLTISIKKILSVSGYSYVALYREKTISGLSSIDGRKIKFYWIRKESGTISGEKLLKRIKKMIKITFGDKYYVHKDLSSFPSSLYIHKYMEK